MTDYHDWNRAMTDAEQRAVEAGQGIIKNGRYFNTGKTYNADGTLRFDFDASNKRDPWFNGDTFHGYDEQGCPIWNKARHVGRGE